MRPETPATRAEAMAGCVCFALRKATRTATQYFDRALKLHRLRITQLPILVAASLRGPVALAKLAPFLAMDRTTLLRNVRPLVRRRLVDVSPAADSCHTEIRATPAGRALLERVYPDWKRAQDRALESLPGPAWAGSLEALSRELRSAR